MEKHDDPSAPDAETEREYPPRTRFEIWGQEVIEKMVRPSAKSGRVYLPPNWVGHRVKIVRVD